MKKYVCNPVNIAYKYQHFEFRAPIMDGDKIVGYNKIKECAFREAADPSVILYKDKYYMFPSMSKGFWVSDDLAEWEYVSLKNTPHYDYAPDVCVVGDYLYFSASKKGEPCNFYRTKNPINGEYEKVATAFEFWDPALFRDSNGKLYFYWGCSNKTPVCGAELNPDDMSVVGDVREIIFGNDKEHGFERIGDNHISDLPPDASDYEKFMRAYVGTAPFIEGAWMNKIGDKYYLQYAAPGTEYNIYSDGVYVSNNPLDGFIYAENNPYSYKPGGFITGAGHGSTFTDKFGNMWHAASMRISINHEFERRLGIFPAGVDKDGILFCNQRYGDWVYVIDDKKLDPWAEPEMFLLSYGKTVTASSGADSAKNATDENIRTWWQADEKDKTPSLAVDLGEVMTIGAVQINFADKLENAIIPDNSDAQIQEYQTRYIEDKTLYTRWLLEGSTDGKEYETLCDKRNANTDFSHDLVTVGKKLRYIRLTVAELPYGQQTKVSGLRVFGVGNGQKPLQAKLKTAKRMSDLDAQIEWQGDAVGYNVLFGFAPDKLYHSFMVYGKTDLTLRALNKGQKTFVRIDSFNENGITHGEVSEIK